MTEEELKVSIIEISNKLRELERQHKIFDRMAARINKIKWDLWEKRTQEKLLLDKLQSQLFDIITQPPCNQ